MLCNEQLSAPFSQATAFDDKLRPAWQPETILVPHGEAYSDGGNGAYLATWKTVEIGFTNGSRHSLSKGWLRMEARIQPHQCSRDATTTPWIVQHSSR